MGKVQKVSRSDEKSLHPEVPTLYALADIAYGIRDEERMANPKIYSNYETIHFKVSGPYVSVEIIDATSENSKIRTNQDKMTYIERIYHLSKNK